MKTQEVMTRGVETVSPGATLEFPILNSHPREQLHCAFFSDEN